MSIKMGLEYIGSIDPWTDEERLYDEEIVRCEDCKYVSIDQSDHDDREPLWCGFHRMDVKHDGFCAWGKRK